MLRDVRDVRFGEAQRGLIDEGLRDRRGHESDQIKHRITVLKGMIRCVKRRFNVDPQ